MKPRVLSLTGSDFSADTDQKIFKATCLIYGPPGSCKNTVAFSAPGPIFIINLDDRDGPAIKRARKVSGKEIYRCSIKLPDDIDDMGEEKAKAAAKPLLDKFQKNYKWACDKGKQGEIGTIVIDTAGEVTEIVSAATCGMTEIPFDHGRTRGRVNAFWRDFIVRRAKSCNVNLVILGREKEIWIGKKATGIFGPRVPSALLAAVDWAAYSSIVTRAGKMLPEYQLTMSKCGGDLMDIGQTLTEKDWKDDGPFAYICYNQWDGSKWSDWGVED